MQNLHSGNFVHISWDMDASSRHQIRARLQLAGVTGRTPPAETRKTHSATLLSAKGGLLLETFPRPLLQLSKLAGQHHRAVFRTQPSTSQSHLPSVRSFCTCPSKMAMVHPSRMGLVPQDPPDLGKRGRSPSPPPRSSRRRSPSADSRQGKDEFGRDRPGKDRDRDGDRDRDRERDERRSGFGDRSRRHDRDRARADDYFNDDKEGQRDSRDDDRRRRRSRSRTVDRERDREREERREREKESGRTRRASPDYGDYRRPSPGRGREDDREQDRNGDAGAEKAPWRQQENMYPNRGGRQPQYGGHGGGADFMDR